MGGLDMFLRWQIFKGMKSIGIQLIFHVLGKHLIVLKHFRTIRLQIISTLSVMLFDAVSISPGTRRSSIR